MTASGSTRQAFSAAIQTEKERKTHFMNYWLIKSLRKCLNTWVFKNHMIWSMDKMKTITAIIALIFVINNLVNNLILWNVMIIYVKKNYLI